MTSIGQSYLSLLERYVRNLELQSSVLEKTCVEIKMSLQRLEMRHVLEEKEKEAATKRLEEDLAIEVDFSAVDEMLEKAKRVIDAPVDKVVTEKKSATTQGRHSKPKVNCQPTKIPNTRGNISNKSVKPLKKSAMTSKESTKTIPPKQNPVKEKAAKNTDNIPKTDTLIIPTPDLMYTDGFLDAYSKHYMLKKKLWRQESETKKSRQYAQKHFMTKFSSEFQEKDSPSDTSKCFEDLKSILPSCDLNEFVENVKCAKEEFQKIKCSDTLGEGEYPDFTQLLEDRMCINWDKQLLEDMLLSQNHCLQLKQEVEQIQLMTPQFMKNFTKKDLPLRVRTQLYKFAINLLTNSGNTLPVLVIDDDEVT